MTREIKRCRTITYLVRLAKKFKTDAFSSWASGVRWSAFFSRGEGMVTVNADSALNQVTGKGSNAWVVNWIYPKRLLAAFIIYIL